MKLCMYVGYHDANNVSDFGGSLVTQYNLKNVKKNVICHFVFKVCVELDIMRKRLEEHFSMVTK